MARFDKEKAPSLRMLMKVGFMALLVILVFFIVFYNIYSVTLVQNQIVESNRRTIAVYAESVDSRLKLVDAYLSDMVANESEFYLLGSPDTALNVHLWSRALLDTMKNQLRTSQVSGLFLYSHANDSYFYDYRDGAPIEERLYVVAEMQEMIRGGEYVLDSRWQPITINEESYILRVQEISGVVIIALIDLDLLTVDMPYIDSESDYTLVYFDNEGQPLSNQEFVTANQIDLSRSPGEMYLSGSGKRWWVIGHALKNTGVSMAALVRGHGFLQGLSTLHLLIFVLSVCTIFIIPFGYYSLRTAVLDPLDRITATIRQIGEGQQEQMHPEQYRMEEFMQIGDTFNTMMGQINGLKIQAYEQALAKKQAQLQYLHLQIRPHFFLNCLKGLYGLAEEKKTAEIQEMILGLSGYFRYIFRYNLKTVPLQDELKHISHYIRLQQLNTRVEFACSIDVDPRATNCRIPPLSIQTFVENSVLHGERQAGRVEIGIRLEMLEVEGEQMLNIAVSDNGGGFPAELLQELNSPVEDIYRENHVGILNVRVRTRLIYGDKAELFFYNDARGAVSELIIPAWEAAEE